MMSSVENFLNRSYPRFASTTRTTTAIRVADCCERVRLAGKSNSKSNRNLKTSKALLESQARQGIRLFTSAVTNQRGFSKQWSREVQVQIPEGQEGTELNFVKVGVVQMAWA